MAWLYLLLGGVCEGAWVYCVKKLGGFSTLYSGFLTVLFILAGPFFVSLAMKTLPASSSYFIWIAMAALSIFLSGLFLYGESFTLLRLICLGLIVAGIIGLKLLETA